MLLLHALSRFFSRQALKHHQHHQHAVYLQSWQTCKVFDGRSREVKECAFGGDKKILIAPDIWNIWLWAASMLPDTRVDPRVTTAQTVVSKDLFRGLLRGSSQLLPSPQVSRLAQIG